MNIELTFRYKFSRVCAISIFSHFTHFKSCHTFSVMSHIFSHVTQFQSCHTISVISHNFSHVTHFQSNDYKAGFRYKFSRVCRICVPHSIFFLKFSRVYLLYTHSTWYISEKFIRVCLLYCIPHNIIFFEILKSLLYRFRVMISRERIYLYSSRFLKSLLYPFHTIILREILKSLFHVHSA